jgi:pimeloyl-ACP methyl ester carboxylesterase
MADRQIGKFRSGEVEIFYRLFGVPGRTPVIIVHGLSFFSYDWIKPASELSIDRQVVAMDMRGFGDSDWPGTYSVPAFAGDIVALLDHMRWRKAVLVGHSMGGRNCTWCAAENPDRIAGLILVDWSPENAPAGSKRVAETVANTPENFATIEDAMRYFKINPDSPEGIRALPRFEAYLKRVPAGYAIKRDAYFRNQFRRMIEIGERPKLGVDLWGAVARIECPILVIRGTRSDMFAAETVPRLRESNPRIRLVELDAGHDVAGDNPTSFFREARSFLEALSE